MVGRNLPFVVFPIEDLSQPFRRPSELRRLAEAVRDTDDYDETRWIEWKSRLPLTQPSGKLHLVKQILGFANRDPAVAAQWCQGNAYLLVGVSPGEVAGVEAVDHQMLNQHLLPYLGTEVVWTPEYVEVGSHTVLVIEVGPPSAGDPIHFLMKDLFLAKAGQSAGGADKKPHGFNEGTIFIRRPGTTERANHEERQMLLRRARSAGARLEAQVTPLRSTIENSPLSADRLVAGIEQQRSELLAARYEPSAGEELAQPVDSALRRIASAWSSEPDPRSWEQYQTEIEEYLAAMQAALRDFVASALEEHPAAQLALTLVNNSERPSRGVVVTAVLLGEDIANSVRCLTPGEQVTVNPVQFPDQPVPFGTPRRRPMITAPMNVPSFASSLPSFRMPMPTSWQAEHTSEGLEIVFDAVDLRAHACISLEPVPLYIELPNGSLLRVRWIAAGIDTQGQDTGAFALTVESSTLNLKQVLQPDDGDEGEVLDR